MQPFLSIPHALQGLLQPILYTCVPFFGYFVPFWEWCGNGGFFGKNFAKKLRKKFRFFFEINRTWGAVKTFWKSFSFCSVELFHVKHCETLGRERKGTCKDSLQVPQVKVIIWASSNTVVKAPLHKSFLATLKRAILKVVAGQCGYIP